MMTKLTYNYLLDQIKGLEVIMVLIGCSQTKIDNQVEGLTKIKYDNHSQYLLSLASGLLAIAENDEKYEICSALQKLINKINGTNNNPGINN
jgi:hypothetical protein